MKLTLEEREISDAIREYLQKRGVLAAQLQIGKRQDNKYFIEAEVSEIAPPEGPYR